jgi:hypothetical protein
VGKIIFPGGGKWVALSQSQANRIAVEGRALTSDLRLLLAATGKMNDSGHAHFEPTHTRTKEPGELRRLLGTVDANGELRPMSARNVYKIKQKLADAGLLVDASGGETCVWVASDLATRDAGLSLCPFHLHRKSAYGSIRSEPSTEHPVAA